MLRVFIKYCIHLHNMNKTVVLIGAGNVATHIALNLIHKGCTLLQVWSRTILSAKTLADRVGCEAITDISDIKQNADLYIISVADSALGNTIKELSRVCKTGVVVHTAGSVPMCVFENHFKHYGVLYPMQTFSKQKKVEFKSIPCFVEASDEQTLDFIKTIANLLTNNVYELSSDNRRWLHLSAVFACNFTNACYRMAQDILEKHGIDFDVMLPLLDETTAKLHTLKPSQAQTGPAARKDYNVMDEHVAMLNNDANLQNIYRLMSAQIISMSKD